MTKKLTFIQRLYFFSTDVISKTEARYNIKCDIPKINKVSNINKTQDGVHKLNTYVSEYLSDP